MLARALLFGLVVEFTVDAALLSYLLPQLQYGWIAALAIAAYCSLRLLLVLTFFAVARKHRGTVPEQHRTGVVGALRLIAVEWAWTTLCYLSLQPLARVFDRSTRQPGPGRPVVVLVHGYLENGGVWWAMRRFLERHGCSVFTHTYEPFYRPIDSHVPGLHERIESIRATLGVEQLILLAHSMGGLLVRAYLRRHGRASVERLITLGTPHQGTPMAVFGLGETARQMRPGNPWLTELAAHERNAPLPPMTAIYSHHDELVVPQGLATHPRADNVAVGGIGHQTLPFSGMVQAMVLDEITRADRSDRSIRRS